MASGSKGIICIKCDRKINRYDDTITCSANCRKSYHIECAKVTLEHLRLLTDTKKLKEWKCNGCAKSNETNTSTVETEESLEETSKTIESNKKTETYLKDILTIVCELKEENLILKNEINELRKLIQGRVNSTPTFADVIKNKEQNEHVIIVKPRTEQNSEVTRMDIKSKICPVEMAAGVSVVKNVKQGGIILSCDNARSKERFKNSINKELGKTYIVDEPRMKKPKMLVLGVDPEEIENIEDEIIIKKI